MPLKTHSNNGNKRNNNPCVAALLTRLPSALAGCCCWFVPCRARHIVCIKFHYWLSKSFELWWLGKRVKSWQRHCVRSYRAPASRSWGNRNGFAQREPQRLNRNQKHKLRCVRKAVSTQRRVRECVNVKQSLRQSVSKSASCDRRAMRNVTLSSNPLRRNKYWQMQ